MSTRDDRDVEVGVGAGHAALGTSPSANVTATSSPRSTCATVSTWPVGDDDAGAAAPAAPEPDDRRPDALRPRPSPPAESSRGPRSSRSQSPLSSRVTCNLQVTTVSEPADYASAHADAVDRRQAPTAPTSPLADALARVGDRWTLLARRRAARRPERASTSSRTSSTGSRPNVLSARLKALTEQALVVVAALLRAPAALRLRADRARARAAPARCGCWPTGAPAPAAASRCRHAACGTALEARWWCPSCERRSTDVRRRRRQSTVYERRRRRAGLAEAAAPARRSAAARAPTRPSDGCTSTQPWPVNAIWIDSPEPRPIRFFILKSVLIAGRDARRPGDRGLGVGERRRATPTLSSTGGPSERIATQPVPCSERLNSPPRHHRRWRPRRA